MSQTPVILEINQNVVKGVQFKPTFSEVIIEHSASAPLDPEKDILLNQVAIINFIHTNFPKGTIFYLNIPDNSYFIRNFKIPFVEPKKIHQVIPFELESILPYSANEILFKYNSYLDKEEAHSQIFAFGCHKDIILPYLYLFKEHNIPIGGIYSHVDAIYRFFDRYATIDSGSFIYISGLSSIVALIENKQWVFVRNIPIGYKQMLIELSEKLERSLEDIQLLYPHLPTADYKNIDFEFYRKNFGLSKNQIRVFLEVVSEFVRILTEELMMSIRSNIKNTELHFDKILQIIIADNNISEIPFEREFHSRIGCEVVPFPYQKLPFPNIQKDYLVSISIASNIADKKWFNFLNKDLTKLTIHKSPWQQYSLYFSLFIGSLFFIASFVFEFWEQKQSLLKVQKQNIEIYNQYFGSYSGDTANIVTTASDKVNLLKRKTEIFTKFYQTKKLGEIIFNLNQAMPIGSNLEITELYYDEKSVNFEGATVEYDTFSTIEQNLLKSSITDSLNCSKRKAPGDAGVQTWKFNCQVKLKLEKQK